MKAKEYLQKVQRLDVVINQKMDEAVNLRLKSGSINGVDYSKQHGQTNHSLEAPFVKSINRVIDLEEEIDLLEGEKHEIINQIQNLPNSKHIEVLYKRYVEFKTFEKVADEMNFTYQYVVELHGHALKNFQKTYESQLKTFKNL